MSRKRPNHIGPVSAATFRGAAEAGEAGAWHPGVESQSEGIRTDRGAVTVDMFRGPVVEVPAPGEHRHYAVSGPLTIMVRDGDRVAWQEGSGRWWGDDTLVDEIEAAPAADGDGREHLGETALRAMRWAIGKGLMKP